MYVYVHALCAGVSTVMTAYLSLAVGSYLIHLVEGTVHDGSVLGKHFLCHCVILFGQGNF